MTGGLVPQQGKVEVCLSGTWSRVCDRKWDYKDSFVVCRQLGYPATKAGSIHVGPCIIILLIANCRFICKHCCGTVLLNSCHSVVSTVHASKRQNNQIGFVPSNNTYNCIGNESSLLNCNYVSDRYCQRDNSAGLYRQISIFCRGNFAGDL